MTAAVLYQVTVLVLAIAVACLGVAIVRLQREVRALGELIRLLMDGGGHG